MRNASGALEQLAAPAARTFTPGSGPQLCCLTLLADKTGLVSELSSLVLVGTLLFPLTASTLPMCSWTVVASRWLSPKSGSLQTSHLNLTLNSNCESHLTKQHLWDTFPPPWGPGSSGCGGVGRLVSSDLS